MARGKGTAGRSKIHEKETAGLQQAKRWPFEGVAEGNFSSRPRGLSKKRSNFPQLQPACLPAFLSFPQSLFYICFARQQIAFYSGKLNGQNAVKLEQARQREKERAAARLAAEVTNSQNSLVLNR